MEMLNDAFGRDCETVPADDVEADRVGPLKAIRRHCLDCCMGSSKEVELCVSTRCPLWLLRFGRRPDASEVAAVADVATHPAEDPKTQADVAGGSRLKAIRRRCLDCSGNNVAEVRGCRTKSCDLHPFRLGKGNRSANMTPERRAALSEQLARARKATA